MPLEAQIAGRHEACEDALARWVRDELTGALPRALPACEQTSTHA